ncbi:MAG: hypothetical protein PHU24_07275 [Sphaerochaetaceae bacterium]|jgi:hypothetical protein|nr:hypothetical protein [Sphaerochaetaceae bacterium]MDD4840519.1 hypothetical protein [Sphaerochaetaceae bacterium]MDD5077221.1 hypothetical protein [Sphaerochaetaceae bacterium]MDX9934313.1 hypothetical protein [Sphaerochaetaceae bacterium]NLO60372.1 iron-containing alcohol dehydrogenase [Spirochaetales bacterium]
MFSNKMTKRITDLTFSCQLYQGSNAVDALWTDCIREGVLRPVVVIAGTTRYQKAIVKKLKKVITSDVVLFTVDEVNTSDLSELIEPFDYLILCGDQGVLDVADLAKQVFRIHKKIAYIPNGLHLADLSVCSSIAIDPDFCIHTTVNDTGAIACSSLFQFITTYAVFDSIVMDSWIATGLSLLVKALSSITGNDYLRLNEPDNTSDVITSGFIAALCAANRGNKPIVGLSKALTVTDWSNIHQSRAALLPHMLTLMKQQDRHRYAEFAFMIGSDPIAFVNRWIEIAGYRQNSLIIKKLLVQNFELLRNELALQDLKPLFESITINDEETGGIRT